MRLNNGFSFQLVRILLLLLLLLFSLFTYFSALYLIFLPKCSVRFVDANGKKEVEMEMKIYARKMQFCNLIFANNNLNRALHTYICSLSVCMIVCAHFFQHIPSAFCICSSAFGINLFINNYLQAINFVCTVSVFCFQYVIQLGFSVLHFSVKSYPIFGVFEVFTQRTKCQLI